MGFNYVVDIRVRKHFSLYHFMDILIVNQLSLPCRLTTINISNRTHKNYLNNICKTILSLPPPLPLPHPVKDVVIIGLVNELIDK